MVSKPLPKWAMKWYAKLWRKFGSKEFSYAAVSSLFEDQKLVSVTISHLKKNGWLVVGLDPIDSRKRIYSLKNPEEVIECLE